MKLSDIEVDLNYILLDPNNYRFRDSSEFREIPEDKFHLDVNQNRCQSLLKPEISDLISSIKANGFLRVERIVVERYRHKDGYFVVIEGNRRIAALKQIKSEIDAGIIESKNLEETLNAVPCLLAENTEEIPAFREALMGIRHVGGIKQWGGFQRAQLIAELRDKHGLDPQTVSERIGLSVQEVNRRYRAISALNQLLSDEEYGDRASPQMYPLFHEAVSLPIVREWLRWSDESFTFTDTNSREQFYDLLIDTEDEDGQKQKAKLLTYQDVRQLREIIPNAQARAYLLDPNQSFQAAVTAANQAEIQKKWRDEVRQALSAMESITISELRSSSADDIKLLRELASVASKTAADAETIAQKE